MDNKEQKFWNPYLGGVALGLVLLASFLIMGKGLGASGGVYRIGVSIVDILAPAHVGASTYMSSVTAGGGALDSFYVFMVAGVFLGGLLSSYAAGRFRPGIRSGPRIGRRARIGLAFAGGIIMGFAARLTLGCTSGQALSGGALLSAGSWIFMLSVFGGGYAMAYFVRRQWT